MTDFTLPELGENITAGDVLRVLVKPGDTLAKDQPVLELETDKATIEVPSSVAGRVADVKVKAGEKVKVGQSILTVEDGAAAAGAAPPSQAAGRPRDEGGVGANTASKIPADGGLEQHIEGRQHETAGTTTRAAERTEPATAERFRSPAASAVDKDKVVDITRGARAPAEPAAEAPSAPAAPSVRRLARELGVDVNEVAGSGPNGRISIDDVKAHAKRIVTHAGGAAQPAAAEPLPDFTRWGDVERQPMRPVRRKTAEHVAAAWAAIPHVTQHDVADITALEELRKRYAKQAEAAGGVLTITAIAVKVVAAALKVFPQFNTSIDLAADEIVYKKYINIGVAVDTDRGLLVPVIREADAKNIVELSVELSQLAEKARSRKITLDEMQGGSFSISNLGGIGGTAFTPIVNLPEVAILGIARARWEPVWHGGAVAGESSAGDFAARLMLPLSLSYDHRVIDGADGARFLRWVAEALEQPFLLALQG